MAIALGWSVFLGGSAFSSSLGSIREELGAEPLLRAWEFEHPGSYWASEGAAGQWAPLRLGARGSGWSAEGFAGYAEADSGRDKLLGFRASAERGEWGVDAAAGEFSYSQRIAGHWLKWASDTRLLLLSTRRRFGGVWLGLGSGALVPVEGSVLLPLRFYARGEWWTLSMTGLALASDRRSLLEAGARRGPVELGAALSFGGDTLWASAWAAISGRWGQASALLVKGDSLRYSLELAPKVSAGPLSLSPRLEVGSWGLNWGTELTARVSWVSLGAVYDAERGFGASWEVEKCF